MSQLKNEKALIRLLHLIINMSASEKNDFKRHIRNYKAGNSSSQYVQLFDLVNTCWGEVCRKLNKDEAQHTPAAYEKLFLEKFERRFNSKQFLEGKELGVKANYLYQKLLESLRRFNPNNNIRRALYMKLLDIDTLSQRGLTAEAIESIEEARQHALDIEAIPFILDLYSMERYLKNTRESLKVEQLRAIYQDERKWLRQLEMNIELYDLRQETLHLSWSKHNVELDQEAALKINNFLKYVTGNYPLNAFEVQMHYKSVWANLTLVAMKSSSPHLAFIKEPNGIAVTALFREIVELFDQYPKIKKELSERYLSNFNNYLSHDQLYENKIKIEHYQDILTSVHTSNPNFLRHIVMMYLIYYLNNNQFEEACSFLQSVNVWELVKQQSHAVPFLQMQNLRFMAGTAFWIIGDLPPAKRWFSSNQTRDHAHALGLTTFASELNALAIQYEMGLLTEPITRKERVQMISKKLKELPNLYPFKPRFIKLLDEILLRGIGKNLSKKDFMALAANWAILEEDNASFSSPNHFQLFIAWLHSKAENKPLRNIIVKH